MTRTRQSILTSGGHAFVAQHLTESAETMTRAAADEAFVASCVAIASACVESLEAGGKLLLAGNGGSAGDAQHIAGEFVSRLNFDRAPLAAIALTVDTSVLTAIGNDYGYEKVFERQVMALTRPGDVVIGISTSGRSPNVLAALCVAREKGARTVGFCGSVGSMAPYCDLLMAVPSASTPQIQQIHITAAHAICGLVELAMFRDGG
jgi:D-sedoheptulose 7-phosphate isomerase